MSGQVDPSPDHLRALRDPQRLAALHATGLLDSPPEAAFDRVTRLAAKLLGAPVSLVSLLDAERQFIKSAFGLELRERSLSPAFCRHVVARGRGLVVPDGRRDPLVTECPSLGGLRVIAYAGVPLCDEAGERLGALCVIDPEPRRWTDEDLQTLAELAELVRSEIALRRHAAGAEARAAAVERMGAIVQAAQDAIIGKTLEGIITHWNPAAERMYGYRAEEAIGRSITMLAVTPEQEAEFAGIHARIAAGEQVEHYETIRRRRDGTILDVSVAVAPVRDLDGRVIGASTVASDITARRDAERQRERLARLLAEAQALAGLGSWEIDTEQRATWTEQVPAIFGIAPESLTAADSRAMRELIHPEDLDVYLQMLDGVQETGAPGQVEFRILRGDGAVRILEARARRLPADEGASLVGTIMDVTEMRALEREATAARDRLAGVLDAATETSIIGTDPSGRITVFNRGAEKLLGWSAQELIGRRTLLALHDLDEVRARAAELGIPAGLEVLAAAARSGRPETREWTYVRKDRTRIAVSLTVTALRTGDDALGGYIAVARDVSEARSAELARREAERRFQAAFEHAPIGVALTGMRGERRGCVLQGNRALAAMVGRAPGELDGVPIEEIVHPADRGHGEAVFARLDRGETTVTERRHLHRDGREIWVLASSTPVPGEDGEAPEYCVTQVLDISERKRFESQLRHLADHDALTGLINRHRFESELDRVLSEARRYGRRGALLMLDLDGFKHVNDRFGHPAGDELVSRIGSLLRETVRETDIVARLGGDEFAVLLHDTSEADAAVVAESLLQAIRRRGVVTQELRHGRVTTSIGIASFDGESRLTGEELVVEADIAMYDAKDAGRDRAVAFDRAASRREPDSRRGSWLPRLNDALAHDRFELHAQPIIGIGRHGIPRYELLLRLRGQDGELVLPGAFLAGAERFELMGAIDRWVLERAVGLLHAHTAAGHRMSLAVNLSGRTMNDPELAGDLAAMLRAHPVPEGLLVIEVSETAAIGNLERARGLAGELRRLGCRFALDDFGAGFASFLHLKHLDLDVLKIDGEFIRQLPSSPSDQLVVRAVVDIARGLGAETVAEFVGDDETVALLRRLGVDHGQGYHLGRPGPVAEVIAPGLAPAPLVSDGAGRHPGEPLA